MDVLFPGLGHGPFFSNTTPGGNFEAETPLILILNLISFFPHSPKPQGMHRTPAQELIMARFTHPVLQQPGGDLKNEINHNNQLGEKHSTTQCDAAGPAVVSALG